MQDIKNILSERKKHLQKECWSNKIRIDEINRIISVLEKQEDKYGKQ